MPPIVRRARAITADISESVQPRTGQIGDRLHPVRIEFGTGILPKEAYGVKRDRLLEQYSGAELEPNRMKSISNLAARGWKEFAKSEGNTIRDIRAEIQNLATETGISISEFRRIVHMVQKGERE
eukprot:gene43129-58403_t